MGLFDSPWHILIVVIVLVLLFGSAKLPKAAKSLGEAMRIFKSEAQKLHDDDSTRAQVHQPFTQQELTPQQPPAAAQAPLVTQQAPAQQAPAAPPVADAVPPPSGNLPS